MTSEEMVRLAEEIADPNFIENYAAVKQENHALAQMLRKEYGIKTGYLAANMRLMQQVKTLSDHNDKLRGMLRSVRAAINVPDGPGV